MIYEFHLKRQERSERVNENIRILSQNLVILRSRKIGNWRSLSPTVNFPNVIKDFPRSKGVDVNSIITERRI